ncbi:PP2C-like domain-containing protein CG9801 [Actinia tenebrosa]|uniref:PP2C-like domain-containing protein CG9801 n=1 Tax=Actinia tenebrosa TaxID=6105 RepID=A0A6P8IQF1_ACTTE|nr:PP2C-like domain-containing protein CG9801 [Actinia tenebrosa]
MVEESEIQSIPQAMTSLKRLSLQELEHISVPRTRHARRLSLPILSSLRDIMKQENNVDWSKAYTDLPCEKLAALGKQVTMATTGPGDGIRNVSVPKECIEAFRPETSGSHHFRPISEWSKRHGRAYGMATSLYEYNQTKNHFEGDPIADVYAIVARPNSCILSIADGVNWGEKSRLAARCAVAGSVQYLQQYLSTATNTHQVMQLLLQSFEAAQECIIKKQAAMTTLCTAIVCEVKGSDEWALCMVNVGDSLGYVYNEKDGVREITIGSHATLRDMRCPGGSLGPVDGYNPDLRNLTFSYTRVSTGDIVFLTSDGVSDNFDPVVSQCNHCQGLLKPCLSMDSIYDKIKTSSNATVTKEDTKVKTDVDKSSCSEWDVPALRQRKVLSDMKEIIEKESPDDVPSAQGLCANLISYVCKCTASKRNFLERVDREELRHDPLRRVKETEICRVMKELPGKLDHAAVVAFEVGEFPAEPLKMVSEGTVLHNKGVSLVEKIKEKVQNLTHPHSPDDAKTELVNLFNMPV